VFDNLEMVHIGENQLPLKKDTEVNFLKKLAVTQLIKKFPSFYGAQQFKSVFSKPIHGILSQINPVHIPLPIPWPPE